MQEGMNKYGFTTDDLRKAENVDFKTMHQMFMDTGLRIQTNAKRGLKTLVVIHYGGHGVIHKGVTQAFVNDPDP